MDNDPRVAQIPSGPYCYDGTTVCPFFQGKHYITNGVDIAYCSYLKLGSIGDLTDEQFEALKEFHSTSSDEDIFELYPLALLWDQVKECGENE